ncbi:hypothetical protein T07_1056 [Trichinella nelsoni]|uniref:Uncharacterized protein n=1 Tax=Trichinella nelsoni TaxID=6336 RepID=A0A0V0SHW0_9BILA|nr:hypothetical protein T07_1056 [Trichinella nelsoni]
MCETLSKRTAEEPEKQTNTIFCDKDFHLPQCRSCPVGVLRFAFVKLDPSALQSFTFRLGERAHVCRGRLFASASLSSGRGRSPPHFVVKRSVSHNTVSCPLSDRPTDDPHGSARDKKRSTLIGQNSCRPVHRSLERKREPRGRRLTLSPTSYRATCHSKFPFDPSVDDEWRRLVTPPPGWSVLIRSEVPTF